MTATAISSEILAARLVDAVHIGGRNSKIECIKAFRSWFTPILGLKAAKDLIEYYLGYSYTGSSIVDDARHPVVYSDLKRLLESDPNWILVNTLDTSDLSEGDTVKFSGEGVITFIGYDHVEFSDGTTIDKSMITEITKKLEPLAVGDTCKYFGDDVKILALDGDDAWVSCDGCRFTALISDLKRS